VQKTGTVNINLQNVRKNGFKTRGLERLRFMGKNINIRKLGKLEVLVRGYIQKFPDWPPGARTENGIALCHKLQLYRYFVCLVNFAAITL
jgi:hypothetical protein